MPSSIWWRTIISRMIWLVGCLVLLSITSNGLMISSNIHATWLELLLMLIMLLMSDFLNILMGPSIILILSLLLHLNVLLLQAYDLFAVDKCGRSPH
jgi:hypothetical protein